MACIDPKQARWAHLTLSDWIITQYIVGLSYCTVCPENASQFLIFLSYPIRRPDTTKQGHLCLAGYLKRLLQEAERGKIKLKLKVFNDVEDLLHRVSNILKKITPLVMENDPLFYPLLNSQWTYYKPYMYREQDYDEGQKDEADAERFSQCVREITGSRISNSDLCTISDVCWEAMMTKGAPTSILYYQVMFFILGEASGKVELCSVWLIKRSIWIYVTGHPRCTRGTPNFKWQGWSNGGKNQNPKKSLGLQTKPKQIPWPKFNPQKIPCQISSHKNFQKALSDITRKIETLVLNTPKNTCQNFPTKKNPEIENLTPPKKTFHHPCHLKSRVPPPPPLPGQDTS